MPLNSKGLYLSSEKGKIKLLSCVQVLHKTDVKEVSVQSCIDSKVINKLRNRCSCKVVSFSFLPFLLPSPLSLLKLPIYRLRRRVSAD